MASGFIAELLDAYCADHAGVRIEYTEGDAANHVLAVQQHRLDVAFLTGTPTDEGCDLATYGMNASMLRCPKSTNWPGR